MKFYELKGYKFLGKITVEDWEIEAEKYKPLFVKDIPDSSLDTLSKFSAVVEPSGEMILSAMMYACMATSILLLSSNL